MLFKKDIRNAQSRFCKYSGKTKCWEVYIAQSVDGREIYHCNSKAQTTRHRIFGIYNEEDVQIVFSDTPGVLDPKYELQEKMMDFVKESLQDADVFFHSGYYR